MSSAKIALASAPHSNESMPPPCASDAAPIHRAAPHQAPVWQGAWHGALQWVLLTSVPLALTILIKPQLMGFWRSIIALWSSVLGMPWIETAIAGNAVLATVPQSDGSFMPSSLTLNLTWLGLASLWGVSHFFQDRFYPLKVMLRGLCLIQASACIFFMLAPADFPYTVTRHMNTLLDMGYSLMLAAGPMLALGWGILKHPLAPKIIAPLGVLAYFAIMLPHKVLLHAWLLEKGSVLFMPALFLCFGALLDVWLFIALYAWLASRIPHKAEQARPQT